MKIKTYIIACLLLVAVATGAEEKPPPTFPSEIVASLQPSIPAGWTVKTDARSIVISRDEKLPQFHKDSIFECVPDETTRDEWWGIAEELRDLAWLYQEAKYADVRE